MAERRYGEARPKTDTTLAGADWYGRQIERERHENTLFVDLDLTEAQTVGVVFHECIFRRARFNASSHQASAFVNCTFVSCKFFDSRFTECKFVGSMFDACEFDQMRVSGGDWSFAGLPGAALGRASFKDTRLREADLTGASCNGGSLRDVDLSGAWLHGVDFFRLRSSGQRPERDRTGKHPPEGCDHHDRPDHRHCRGSGSRSAAEVIVSGLQRRASYQTRKGRCSALNCCLSP
ncbi:pentapeptide repeat-containing protein [Ensifer sp. IC3342]|nr:pentapeptide repeat-containing protein [Ensifer sp. BRP08]MCA1448671.1 pentapeptide repeat-containing protein [Ensifer sp. IC3342]